MFPVNYLVYARIHECEEKSNENMFSRAYATPCSSAHIGPANLI